LFRVSAAKALAMLGLSGVLVLDAGDAASYDGSAQQWNDLSGGGNHFNRGSTNGADATDPTFVGTAGRLSQGEYFSFDGGDFLTPVGAPTFDDAWHLDNATVSMVALFFHASAGTKGIFGNSDSSTAQGIRFGVTANGQFLCKNGSGTATNMASVGLVGVGEWNFIGCSVNEAAGANGSVLRVNSRVNLRDGTYATPGVGVANSAPQIGARGGTSVTNILLAGDRVAIFVAASVAWSRGQMAAFHSLMKGRFPSI
jgi:hypothetical protein